MCRRIIPLLFCIVYLSNAQQITISNFKDTSIKCDYLIITPSEFSSAALTLANYRNSFEGDSVHFAKVAILEDILTQFQDTLSRSKILHNAIKWAYNNWSAVRLRYVVLIGDDSLSFRRSDSTWLSQGHMPAWILDQNKDERFPYCGSDQNYVLSDNDSSNSNSQHSLLKMSIGRIPCENSEQLKTYINKVISFESSTSGQWKNRVLAIADDYMQGSQPDPLNHQLSSDSILNSGFQNRFVKKFYLSRYKPDVAYEMPDARNDLIREINKNYFVTLFVGHGAPYVLTDEHILTIDYCDSIRNSNPGLFICLTSEGGVFFDPYRGSIAERLLFKTQGGFIAVIGSPNLTYATANESFGRSLATSFLESTKHSLGELFNEAYPYTSGPSNIYVILGDPALIVKHDTLDISIYKSNDLLTLQTNGNDTLNYSFIITTSKHFTATSSNGRDFDFDSAIYADSGKMLNSVSRQLPFLNNTNYDISVYVWDKNNNEGRLRVPVSSITGIKTSIKKQNTSSQFIFEKQSLLIYSTLNKPQSFEFALYDLQGRTVFNKSGVLNGNSVRISLTEKSLANRYYIFRLRKDNQMFTGNVLIDKSK